MPFHTYQLLRDHVFLTPAPHAVPTAPFERISMVLDSNLKVRLDVMANLML